MIFRLNLTSNVFHYLQNTKLIVIYLNYFNFKNFIVKDANRLTNAIRFIWRNTNFKKTKHTYELNTRVIVCTQITVHPIFTKTLLSRNVYVNFKTTFNLSHVSLYYYKNPKYLVFSLFKFYYSTQFLNLLYLYNINFKKLYYCLKTSKFKAQKTQQTMVHIKPLTTFLINYI